MCQCRFAKAQIIGMVKCPDSGSWPEESGSARMSAVGRGCVKTRNPRVFRGRFGIPEGAIVEYRAIFPCLSH